jgi:hypothetical protein
MHIWGGGTVLKTVGSEILRRREHLADLNLMEDNFKVNFL